MSVCVYSVFVFFCVQLAALWRADPPVQGVEFTEFRFLFFEVLNIYLAFSTLELRM
jgi:hypothetical protein